MKKCWPTFLSGLGIHEIICQIDAIMLYNPHISLKLNSNTQVVLFTITKNGPSNDINLLLFASTTLKLRNTKIWSRFLLSLTNPHILKRATKHFHATEFKICQEKFAKPPIEQWGSRWYSTGMSWFEMVVVLAGSLSSQ
jgi:hypothetical protein